MAHAAHTHTDGVCSDSGGDGGGDGGGDPFFLVSHRGWRGPDGENGENTLEAVLGAAHRPAFKGVEVDVMLTTDGMPYLMHDETLARTTGDPRRSESVSRAAIGLLETLPQKQSVPFLRDVVTQLYQTVRGQNRPKGKPFWLYLDIKSEHPSAVAIIQSVVRDAGVDRDDAHLRIVMIHPNITTIPQGEVWYDTASFSGYGTHYAAPYWVFYVLWPVREAFVWTVNTLPLIELMKTIGAKAVITDLPL